MVESTTDQNLKPAVNSGEEKQIEGQGASDAKVDRYAYYKKIGCPKYFVAPMVDQSELPYRMLTRNHGAQICYTPMLHSRLFATEPKYRQHNFKACPEDRPLAVQFCSNDPDTLLQAAKFVENDCDAVDINLGCPQGIARKGNYGSFLLEQKDLIVAMVSKLHKELKVPVTCKIRCLPTEQQTLELALAIQDAGASLLTVHGRCKEHNKHLCGATSYDIIRKVKQALDIPVIANGGIATFDDIQKCMDITGVDGVMACESILEYPALFDNSKVHDLDELTLEYIDLFEKYPGEADMKTIRSHMFKFLYTGLQVHTDLRSELGKSKTVEELRAVALELQKRRKDETPESKITWYYRHWRGMGLTRGETSTWVLEAWDEKCIKDPLLNKDLQPEKKKKKKKGKGGLSSLASKDSDIVIDTNVAEKRPRQDDSLEKEAAQEEEKAEQDKQPVSSDNQIEKKEDAADL